MLSRLQQFRDKLLADIRATFPEPLVVDVKFHRGPFDDDALRRYAVRAPAAILAAGDIQKIQRIGGSTLLPTSWGLYFVTKDARPDDDSHSLALIERASENVFSWGDIATANVMAPTNIEAANLWNEDTDKMKLSLWALKWDQSIRIPPMTQDEFDSLNEFLRLHSEVTPVPSTDNTTPIIGTTNIRE